MSEDQTELLWTRYSFMDGGVAIQSTFERLKSCLNIPNAVYIGKIKYKDWDTERTTIDSNMMNLLLLSEKTTKMKES